MKKIKKALLLSLSLVLFFVLTGCSSSKGIDQPITKDTFFVIKWFGWLYKFLAINNKFGWGIIFGTLIIRTCAWPVYSKSNDMTLKMSVMQPEMDRINLKYATRKDPESQQKMQMEMMRLYKKYKINPVGCIVLQALQMFLFTMTWQVVSRIPIEGGLYVLDSDFLLWDLSKASDFKEPITIILPLLVGATMLAQQLFSQTKPKYQKNIPTPKVNSQANQMQSSMKIMMYFMVFMMVTVAWSNNALALYWVVGNTFSLGQMYIGRKMSEKKYYKLTAQK